MCLNFIHSSTLLESTISPAGGLYTGDIAHDNVKINVIKH